MLRLPADLQQQVIFLARAEEACSLTCRALRNTVTSPDSVVRLYLAAHSTQQSCELLRVYRLLSSKRLRTWAQSKNGAMITVQMMLECAGILRVFDKQQQQESVKALQSLLSTATPESAVQLLQSQLPFAEHCLLPFCAQGGHVELVKAQLSQAYTPALGDSVLHYVKTSAFLAAAAGGQTAVLLVLLSANATNWACQLPGVSLTRAALDLAAQGGHLETMKLLKNLVDEPNSSFLIAAADSGNGPAMEWALGFWFEQFNAVTAFGPPHIRQMHDALRVACQRGHLCIIRQLLRYLHAVRCHDCCVLALSYTCSTSNTEAMRCIVESPYLPQQLKRGGPKLLEQLAIVVASCLRIAIRIHKLPSLQLLLDGLGNSTSALASARPLLSQHMPSVFDQAAVSGNTAALQLLLTHLPEQYDGLGFSALEAALSEGHQDVAQVVRALLIMRGPDQGFTAAALSPEMNPNIARAVRQGAFKLASRTGDVMRLQQLLQQGPEGPYENDQLLMLRLAAAAGQEEAVRLLLGRFGAGSRSEMCARAACRGAVHAGQLTLLKSLAADSSCGVQQHLTSQCDALCEYLRAALLCGQVQVATWLVQVAGQQQQLGLVTVTLQSLLTTSRWELWNTGVGNTGCEAVAHLIKALADQATGGASTAALTSAGQMAAAAAAAGQGIAAEDQEMVVVNSADALTAEQAVQVLTPQLLNLLLNASSGDPDMLFTVVSAVSALGVASKQQQQTEQLCKVVVEEGVDVSSGSNSSSSTALTAAPTSFTTASSASSCAGVDSGTGGQRLRRQTSRFCPRSSGALETGFSSGGVRPHSPSSPASSEPLSLQCQRNCSSWRSGVLRPAASDPEALRAVADQLSSSGDGLCEPQFGDAAGGQWGHRSEGLSVGTDSGSASSSQERLLLEKLHGALSEPLGEVLLSPVDRASRRPQPQQQQQRQRVLLKQPQRTAGQGRDCLQHGEQQQNLQQGPHHDVRQHLQLARLQPPQQQDSGIRISAVKQLKQLMGQVQQLSVSTPSSPQHPYMVQHKQLLLQHNSLKRSSQPEYGTREQQQQQQQRQLRTAVSLPAARMAQPQHPYMQNYHQQLQQQKELGSEAASPA